MLYILSCKIYMFIYVYMFTVILEYQVSFRPKKSNDGQIFRVHPIKKKIRITLYINFLTYFREAIDFILKTIHITFSSMRGFHQS